MLSTQPFQITILLIFAVISVLPLLHTIHFFHWTNYIILIVYLGGLLILFLYFTTISKITIKLKFLFSVLGFFILCFFLFTNYFKKRIAFTKLCERGLFLFSFPRVILTLFLILFLLFLILSFLSFSPVISSPIRQN